MKAFKSIGSVATTVLLVVGLVAIFCLVTNPSAEDHMAVIDDQLFPAMRQALRTARPASEAAGLADRLSGVLVRAAADEALRDARKRITYHNYLLFSTTSLDGRRITVGFLARVRLAKA